MKIGTASDQLAINRCACDRLYEISIRLHRSVCPGRPRRLDVTVANSGKLEIYLSNLPDAHLIVVVVVALPLSPSSRFPIICKWVSRATR